VKRELSGVGFYTYFETPKNLAIDDLSVRFGDVAAKIRDLKNGAGFVIYIEHGLLKMLEGYTYDEPWPKEVADFELSYVSGNNRDFTALSIH
jgi:hypothetical protein